MQSFVPDWESSLGPPALGVVGAGKRWRGDGIGGGGGEGGVGWGGHEAGKGEGPRCLGRWLRRIGVPSWIPDIVRHPY